MARSSHPTKAARRRPRRVLRWLAQAAGLLVVLALAGLLLIVATLPDTKGLATLNPEGTWFTRAYEKRQALAGRPRPIKLRWVPLSGIPLDVQRAVLIAEDHGFFAHGGVDVAGLREALRDDLESGKPLRGGSTLTMQLAKNLYLAPSRTPLRKVRELLIARKLEEDLSKRRLLEIYLNVIEWGDGVFGIDAAARTYYDKAPGALTSDEAAWLAATIPSPRRANPAHVTPWLRHRHDLLLERMGRWRVEGLD